MAKVPLTEEPVMTDALLLNVEKVGLSHEQFFELCADNPELHLELTGRKELVIMTLPPPRTGRLNDIISRSLANWAEQDGTGVTFSPLTLFVLPNGAMRAPDASWIRLEPWNAYVNKQQDTAPLCPDFVMELVSQSQQSRLKMLQAKMAEYISNGAQLGWLIDPYKKEVYVYRPGKPVRRLENPASISGDPVLPGFVFQISEIW